MAELNSPQMNGVGPDGSRRPYFTGADSAGNPMYEWYSAQEDGTADDWEAAEMANIYDWNKSMYNNWYNSPEQQLQRLQDAGMNPLFFLANNAGTTAAQGPAGANAPNVKHANNKMANLLNATRNVSDSLLTSQKQALDYDIQRRQQEIDLRRVALEDRQTTVQEKQLGLNTKKTEQDIAESKSRIEVNNKSIDKFASEIKLNEQKTAEAQASAALLNKRVDEVEANIANLRAQAGYYNITASRIRQMIPLELENLAAQTNLSYHQASVEVEKMWNFAMDTDKKQVEIEVGRQQRILIERQADGQLKTNLILDADADWRDAEHQMQVVTGYWNAVNGTINGIANVAGSVGRIQMGQAAKAGQLFRSQTNFNPSLNGNGWVKDPISGILYDTSGQSGFSSINFNNGNNLPNFWFNGKPVGK